MLTRPPFTWDPLLISRCAVAMISVIPIPPSLANESSFALATDELKGYCIAEFCLGAKINEVSMQGNISFSAIGLPHGKVDCSNINNTATGTLITKDGRTFYVSFSLASTTGDAESRYRLTSVDIVLPALSELELDHLRDTLANRYNLRQAEGDFKYLWIGKTKSGRFSISTNTKWIKPDTPPDLAKKIKGVKLSAYYSQKKEWLISQPECRSRLPKI